MEKISTHELASEIREHYLSNNITEEDYLELSTTFIEILNYDFKIYKNNKSFTDICNGIFTVTNGTFLFLLANNFLNANFPQVSDNKQWVNFVASLSISFVSVELINHIRNRSIKLSYNENYYCEELNSFINTTISAYSNKPTISLDINEKNFKNVSDHYISLFNKEMIDELKNNENLQAIRNININQEDELNVDNNTLRR